MYNQDLPASNLPSASSFHPAFVFAVYALTAQCRFSSFNLMQIVALHLNPLIFFYNGGITGALAKGMERKSEVEVGGVGGGGTPA